MDEVEQRSVMLNRQLADLQACLCAIAAISVLTFLRYAECAAGF